MIEFDGEGAQLEEHNFLMLAIDAARHGRVYVEPKFNWGTLNSGSSDDELVSRGPRREPTKTIHRRGAD